MKSLKRKKFKFLISFFTIFLIVSVASISYVSAQGINIDFGDGSGSNTAKLIQILLVISLISITPSILIMTTSFTRLIIVFSFLRSAMGLQQAPPNMVFVSLALFLSVFIMSPTLEKVYSESISPLMSEKINEEQALEKAKEPIKQFMLSQVKEDDINLFMSFDKTKNGEVKEKDKKKIDNKEIPFKILVPAFMISELKRSFEIGFLIFIPFLVIDLVVASLLMSMGMMMVPPIMVSLPFKLIFFVLIDGWRLLIESLVKSFTG